MQELLENYIESISSKFSHEETSEMGYRTDFEILIKGIFESINVRRIDHDARSKQGNKPDFIVLNHDIPILYIEAKDIGVSMDKVEKSEQMARYFGYANLVLTDYLEFRFYRNGLAYGEPIKIASHDIKTRTITSNPDKYQLLVKTLLDFTKSHKEPIKSGKHLAKVMGGKAQRIRDNVKQIFALNIDGDTDIVGVYETLRKLLIHDLSPDTFADMYAQTLVYGLFVARYYDESPDTFTRLEARELIPASNPFLGHFFDHIAGRNFEKRLSFIVDELCEVFSHADIKQLISQYFRKDSWGEAQTGPDPVIHFYEDFLKEYDPELRKKMGAYYTPLPVVNFIVRAIDDILQRDFGLSRGLADTAKTPEGIHRVQVLDPAVGTGTFISAVIDTIHERQLKLGQKGGWPAYVHHDLLPRIYGFELMMAPYTIAHLKISIKLQETGFKYFNETRSGKARLNVYLTNSLEDTPKQQELLAFDFGAAIAQEAEEASIVKNKKPIMVVVGNPPYSVSSSNKGEWIQNLIKDYKKGLNERNIQPLSDDYIKFIRFAEHFIEKNNSGIMAMITNNSFLDGTIHRQMRKHLLETFDYIYIIDLHGNSKKKETAPDGVKDENVFDIQQGVAISIFVRMQGEKKELGKVHYSELYGKREDKFKAVNGSGLQNIKWKKLDYVDPSYFFVTKDFGDSQEYKSGFSIEDLFQISNSGVTTSKDSELVSFEDTESEFDVIYSYRPFDFRHIDYDLKKVDRPRYSLMKHMLHDNIGFIAKRGFDEDRSAVCFCSKLMIDRRLWSRPGMLGAEQLFPLYLYHKDGSKSPNLKREIVDTIEQVVGDATPEDIFDYVYAALHSPSYHNKYKEFLKIDFPHVPYPKDAAFFRRLVALGKELRELHLLESPKINKFITTYPESGNNLIEKVDYGSLVQVGKKNAEGRYDYKEVFGRVYINGDQYFGKVPDIAWNFWIGGYQPAQKWLKDRKGRTLTNEDIEHYQKIIVVLTETDRVMKQIDKII